MCNFNRDEQSGILIWGYCFIYERVVACFVQYWRMCSSRNLSIFISVVAHVADDLIVERKWPILSVRRLMTGIGLIGPGIFILLFSDIDNFFLAML